MSELTPEPGPDMREKIRNWFIDLAQGRQRYPKAGVPSAEELADWRTDQILALFEGIREQERRQIRNQLTGIYNQAVDLKVLETLLRDYIKDMEE